MQLLQYHHGPCFQTVPASEDGVEKSLIERRTAHPQAIATQIDRQSQEIQQFLLSQELLAKRDAESGAARTEQPRLQMVALAKRLESRTQALLLQKDQEMVRAWQKTTELEEGKEKEKKREIV